MVYLPYMRTQDTTGRRFRVGKRQPSDRPSRINSTKLRLLEWIHLTGGFASTNNVYHFARTTGITDGKDQTQISRTLKDMWHEDGILTRPPEQRHIVLPDRFDTVHEVSDKGVEVLKAHGLYSEHAPKKDGWYKHQVMDSSIYQWYWNHITSLGLPFTPEHELLAGLPHGREFVIDGEKVTPDGILLTHGKTKPLLIIRETDRATEWGSKEKGTSWPKKLSRYKRFLDSGLWKQWYNVPENCDVQVHIVTLAERMEKKIIGDIRAIYPDKCARILVHTSNLFISPEGDFHAPKYYPILETTWHRAGYPDITLIPNTVR